MHTVSNALIPVILFIALGVLAGRLRWIAAGSVKDLSNLVFLILTPDEVRERYRGFDRLVGRALQTVLSADSGRIRPISAAYSLSAG